MSKAQMKNNPGFKYAALIATSLCIFTAVHTFALPGTGASSGAKSTPNKPVLDKDKDPNVDKTSTSQDSKVQEQQIENATTVTAEQLADKPNDYLNKNVKFTAKFFAFSNLGLDYKPAFRSSRTYLSLMILRPNTHTPFSEIKLDMLIPKEKDPETKMLQTLKEGDQVEIIGHVFATSLDEPWLDVLKIKKLSSEKKNDSADNKEAANDKD